MRKVLYYFFCATVFLLGACESNTKGKVNPTAELTRVPSADSVLIIPMNYYKGGDYTSVQDIRTTLRTMLEHRIKTEPEALSMVTFGYWEPEGVYNLGKMSMQDEYKGYWLDFKEDFTYEYGYYERVDGSGRYHLKLNNMSLLMLDDNPNMEPKVWSLRSNGESIVFVGTHDLGLNNGMQIKWLNWVEKPASK